MSVCSHLRGVVPQLKVLSRVTGPRSFLRGGGTPVKGSFLGHWSQVLSGGYPSPRFFPRSLVPGPFWGIPQFQVLSQVISPRSFPGGIPNLVGGYPVLDGVCASHARGVRSTPQTEQQSKHLLHGGRCASYVHAAGFSCFAYF